MFTNAKTSKSRAVKTLVMVLALVAVLAFCFTACGKAAPVGAEYVAGTLTKSTYNQGETFDCAGAQIKITYDNGTSETVNVTPAMVGNVQLNTIGTTTVNVTYTVEGVSLTASIPVSVADPLSGDRTTAKAAVDAKYAAILNNDHDAGIDALLAEAKAAIESATTKDAITAAVAMFETDVQALKDAKDEVSAAMDAYLASAGLLPQYKTEAKSALDKAKADLKNVLSAKAAEDIKLAFNSTVAQILVKQNFYEDPNKTQGQIHDKIDILLMIKACKGDAEGVIADVKQYGNPAKMEETCAKYEDVIAKLDWYYEYVTLAIDLSGIYEEIQDYFNDAMRTEANDIFDALEDASALDIVPAPYVEGVLGVDSVGELLDTLKDLRADLADNYGVTIADKWAKNFKPQGAETTIDLDAVILHIETLHATLTIAQEFAADIVADIDAIDANTDRDTIAAIWDDIKAWGKDVMFSVDANIEIYDNLIYDKKMPEGTVSVGVAEKEAFVKYTDYDITKAHVILYYLPNLDKLVDASIVLDVLVIGDLVSKIPEYIIYSNTPVDSKAAIDTAENAIKKFIELYTQEIYDEFCLVDGVDVFGKAVADARKEYNELIADADNVNALVAALPELDKITINDYAENGALKAAYEAYCAFAERNSDATTKYTDVITEEATLLAKVERYIAMAFVEQRNVISNLKIYVAADQKVATIDVGDLVYRTAVVDYADAAVALVNTIAFDVDLIEHDNFTLIELLNANLEVVVEACDEHVATITDAEGPSDLQ